MRNVWKFLGSMRFAILLLVILAAACAGGSFISQGLSYEQYAELYTERTAGLIVALQLDDVFHSWWFLLLTVFLCGNLLFCNLLRLPQLLRRTRAAADPAQLGSPAVTVTGVRNPEGFLRRLRMPKARKSVDPAGTPLLFSVRNRAGLWGAWVCHLGILLLVLGFSLGQMTKEEYTVYGVPGQTKQIGDTQYVLAIRDFRMDRHEDGFVSQYETALTVCDLSDPSDVLAQDAVVSVNHPGSCFGYKLYQNSTGSAAKLTVRKDGDPVQETVLCVGERASMLDTPLSVLLRAVLPDDGTSEDGNPVPGYAYMIYVGDELYNMNVQSEGAQIPDFQPYEVFFSEPQSYTLIQIKRDRFTPLALAGGLLTLLGLLLAFYLQMQKVWAVPNEDGTWTFHGQSPKSGALFADRFREAARTEAAPGKPE